MMQSLNRATNLNESSHRIGILGGSFDPPHWGHLMIAQSAFEQLALESVWFVPTFLSPHKRFFHQDPHIRAHLVELMLAQDPRFDCKRVEVDSGRSMYAIETIEQLRSQHPTASFYWIIGTDQLEKLHTWKDFEQLSQLVHWVVLERPGFPMAISEKLKGLSITSLSVHPVDISSSEIRNRIFEGLPVYMFLHPAVGEYIDEQNLYRQSDSLTNA
jgi:nicotinate-nucleotide adenylyltransferase